jgi:hypothetical protein
MRRVLCAALAVALAACVTRGASTAAPAAPSDAAAPVAPGAVNATELPPCTAATPAGVDWREVTTATAQGSPRFCVPADWYMTARRDPAASASGTWGKPPTTWVRWAVGPFRPMAFVPTPAFDRRERQAVIGGRPVTIVVDREPDGYGVRGRWRGDTTASGDAAAGGRPTVVLTGHAVDAAGVALVLSLFETVHFDGAATAR